MTAPIQQPSVGLIGGGAYVAIDTSAYTSARLPGELVAYTRTRGGRRRVLSGSNHPMLTPTRALADLDSLKLDDETRALYLEGNARGIFGL